MPVRFAYPKPLSKIQAVGVHLGFRLWGHGWQIVLLDVEFVFLRTGLAQTGALSQFVIRALVGDLQLSNSPHAYCCTFETMQGYLRRACGRTHLFGMGSAMPHIGQRAFLICPVEVVNGRPQLKRIFLGDGIGRLGAEFRRSTRGLCYPATGGGDKHQPYVPSIPIKMYRLSPVHIIRVIIE